MTLREELDEALTKIGNLMLERQRYELESQKNIQSLTYSLNAESAEKNRIRSDFDAFKKECEAKVIKLGQEEHNIVSILLEIARWNVNPETAKTPFNMSGCTNHIHKPGAI